MAGIAGPIGIGVAAATVVFGFVKPYLYSKNSRFLIGRNCMKRAVLKRAFVLVLLTFLLYACGDFWHPADEGSNGDVNLAGTTWKFQGQNFYGEEQSTQTLNFVDGSTVKLVDVTASNTYTRNGTYTFNGNSGTMTFPIYDPPDWPFVVKGNTLNITYKSSTYTYKKQ
jgi:hypothetical protein